MKPNQVILAVLLSMNLAAAHADDPHAQHRAPLHDGRAVLELSPGERAMILDEMRLFLDGVEKMTGALGRQDMPAVAGAARNLGRKMVHEVPPALRAKLPPEFRQLGFTVHGDFDQIALDAESMKDASYSLNQLSATLQKCVACHASYRIQTPALNASR